MSLIVYLGNSENLVCKQNCANYIFTLFIFVSADFNNCVIYFISNFEAKILDNFNHVET